MNIPAVNRLALAALLLVFNTADPIPAEAHGVTDGWPVYELPIGDEYREGSFFDYRALDANLVYDGSQAIHVARVIPGQSYRLGLRLRSNQAQNLSVSLFDRWPYAEGARPIQLATGGGLRGLDGKQEFQWWFSVDKHSPGSLLYIRVSVKSSFNEENSHGRYRMYIVDSPRSPMNSLGRGVVYHRGPRNLKVLESSPSVSLSFQPFSGVRPVRHVADRGGWNSGRHAHGFHGNLVRNGNFSRGLAHWQVRPVKAKGVGVFDGKLRLWSRESPDASGVVQKLNIDASKYHSLKLSLDLMISAQSEPVQGSGSAPLTLSICYQDIRGGTHCGDSAFRKQFSLALGDRAARRRAEVFPTGVWARYTLDLKDMIPGLGRLISIGLFGSGAPEREAFISRIKIS